MTRPASRRTFIRNGLLTAAAFTAAGAAGAELIARGALPGRTILDKLDGACSVPAPPVPRGPLGPSLSGTFRSAARRRMVGYTIAYPPGHRPGDELPLVVMLHGFGANHADALAGLSPAQALAQGLAPGWHWDPAAARWPPWPWSPSTAATATGTRIRATTRWRW